jgi:pimeloyl-ACP methyl ester carboxylesterase
MSKFWGTERTLRLLAFVLISMSYPIFSVAQLDENQSVLIGGIRQWIQIKGENGQAPVLLFLHGGPGNSAMRYAHKFTGQLEKHFIVVLWDQRETGKTLQLNATNQPLSLALMEADVVEMVDYLLARFGQKKLYVMGHSWGGYLALRMAATIPNKLEACYAISPMIHQLASERLSLAWMVEHAEKTKNTKALAELVKVKVPFENAEQIYFHRSWLAKFTGNSTPPRGFVEQWAAKWLTVFNQASAVDFNTDAPAIDCPVFFFIGEMDKQTHHSLAKEYFERLKAEKKELFWFKKSGHNLNLTEPKRLQELIIDQKTKRN